MKKRILYILVVLLMLLVLSACSSLVDNGAMKAINSENPMIAGSFVDTEGGILGNMVPLVLEEEGHTITDKIQFVTPDDIEMHHCKGS